MTNCENFEHKMDAAVLAGRTEKWILETMAERRVKKPDARRIIAEAIGVRPGALTRLHNGTLKHIERIADQVNAYAVRRIEEKIKTFEHDLAIARLVDSGVAEADLLGAEAALASARQALTRARRPDAEARG
jgi:hypothetical protein